MLTSCSLEKQLGFEQLPRGILANALFCLSDSRTPE
jgi:hypothetical protein